MDNLKKRIQWSLAEKKDSAVTDCLFLLCYVSQSLTSQFLCLAKNRERRKHIALALRHFLLKTLQDGQDKDSNFFVSFSPFFFSSFPWEEHVQRGFFPVQNVFDVLSHQGRCLIPMCVRCFNFFLFFALVLNLTASFHNVARTSVLFSSEISYSVAWQRPISFVDGRVLLAQAESRWLGSANSD